MMLVVIVVIVAFVAFVVTVALVVMGTSLVPHKCCTISTYDAYESYYVKEFFVLFLQQQQLCVCEPQ